MLDSMEVTRVTHRRRAPRYQPKPWERIEEGILSGPGYAYDLENDDLLFFQAPSWTRAGKPARSVARSSGCKQDRGGSMSAKILNYYAFDDGAEITCPECGWSGAAREASVEYYKELFDVSCPRCDRMILIVNYPTPAETKEAAELGNPRAQEEMQFVDARESFLRQFDRRKLHSAEQLPDLEGDRLEFLWDMSWGDEKLTVIRFGEREIWAEPTLWEGFPRFYEMKELLKQRYGSRFSSLTPTADSEMWLYGDEWREDPVKVD
jgi:hypothetical protein